MSDVWGLADEYWSYYRGTEQLWNVDRGDVGQIEHWEDLSAAGVADRIARLTGFARQAETLRAEGLDDQQLTLLGALIFSARATAVGLPYARDLTLVAGSFNFAAFLSVLVPGYTLVTRDHGRGYVNKLRALPEFVDGWISGLRDGLAVGRVATARGVASAVTTYDALLATALTDDPLTSQSPPIEMAADEVDGWRAEVLNAIRDSVRPALARLRDVLRDEVLAVARSDAHAGVCHLPGGEDAYAALLWASTSTDLTPETVHQIGLEQLARLDDEYANLGHAVLDVGDPVQVRERLRSDGSLRYTSADDIERDATAVLARAEAEAPRWFSRVPRARCTATSVAVGPMAFYTGPSPDGARGGTFFFNTANPAAWGRYELESVTFHESVPGHHLQVALANELDLHPIVGELEVTSYGEGWGLYAERLADEMSLYSSPLHRMGMLTADSMRAARLVADTGLHAMGWTREEAVEFVLGHTAQDREHSETEVERYIGNPGQATSYMIGRLEIERLRRHATASLGERFSLQGFHDVVLGQGMTPFDVLAHTVDNWIASSAAR